MRFTDQGIRSLPFEEVQREYAEDSGLILRVGKRTKTFIKTTIRGTGGEKLLRGIGVSLTVRADSVGNRSGG